MGFCEYTKEKYDQTGFIHKFKHLIAGLWFCEAAKGSGVMYKRANRIGGFKKPQDLRSLIVSDAISARWV